MRKEELILLRNSGKKLIEIGKIYGVTKQRIHQIMGNTGYLISYPDGYKKCYGLCKQVLPVSNFYGNSNRCKQCEKINQHKYFSKRYKEYKKGGKYYQQTQARVAIHNAIKKGLIKKTECKQKNLQCSGRIEAHHFLGYNKENWLNVEWYCQYHHLLLDKTPWMSYNKL